MTKKDLDRRRDIAAIIAIGRHNKKSSKAIAEDIMVQAPPSAAVIEDAAKWFEDGGNGLYRPSEVAKTLRTVCKDWVCR